MIKGIEMVMMLSVLVGNGIVSGFGVEDFGVFAVVGHRGKKIIKISDDYR
jgi:hypothetical protein